MAEDKKIKNMEELNKEEENKEINNKKDSISGDNEEKKDSQKEENKDELEFEEEKETKEDLETKVIDLEKEIEKLKVEKENYYNKLQRLQADFINFRKRVSKEKNNLSINTKVELINNLLPVVDNFERALATATTDDNFKEGIDMIYRQFMTFLDKEGVEVISTVGNPFDHNLHEAIMQVEDSEYESGIVVEELQKGYRLGDKVIRPAMVKVAQ